MNELEEIENKLVELYSEWIDTALHPFSQDNIGIKEIAVNSFKNSLKLYRELCIDRGRNS
jgi:hypothetical protein